MQYLEVPLSFGMLTYLEVGTEVFKPKTALSLLPVAKARVK